MNTKNHQGSCVPSLIADIETEIIESLRVKESFLHQCKGTLESICSRVSDRLRDGGKVLIFGNGGSAADAQHVAAEFVGRYAFERQGLPALALTTDTSILTAVSNDYGYREVFARQIGALGRKADVAIGISTSGKSPNILRGLCFARDRGMLTIGFTGRTGGELPGVVDLCLCVPSDQTPRIQECHILAGHILIKHCEQTLARPSSLAATTE